MRCPSCIRLFVIVPVLSGCVALGSLEQADVVPKGSTYNGVKITRTGVLYSARYGVAENLDIGGEAGLNVLSVGPKFRLTNGPVRMVLQFSVSENIVLPKSDLYILRTRGVAGFHPGFMIGHGPYYAFARGSYYNTRSGWRPVDSAPALDAPRWFLYSAGLGYATPLSAVDQTQFGAEAAYMVFPGGKRWIVPAFGLRLYW